MNTRNYCTLFFVGLTVFLFSCKNGQSSANHGPIVLGDSSAIVTEPDSQYLRDFVADLQPVVPSATEASQEEDKDTTATQVATTAQPSATVTPAKQVQQAPAGNGLNAAFKDVTVFIPGITTKTYRNQQNLANANGASFQLTGGNIAGNQLRILSGNVTKVSQRYETIVVAKNNLGTLQLTSLTNETDWQPVRGNRNTYPITGLDAAHLSYPRLTPAAIRNAVSKETRRHNMSRRKQQDWVESVRNVRSANQKPLSVVLRSVVWKVEGKDAKGKPYQKQIRADMPL